MTHQEQVDVVMKIGSKPGREIEDMYSGRFMYGATCYGIITSNPDNVAREAHLAGLKGEKYDNMGLQFIVYWPHIPGKPEE
jgi:hypothetical protein